MKKRKNNKSAPIEELNGKKAWMSVLADYYNGDHKEKAGRITESIVMKKWRDLHYYGRKEIVKEMMDIQGGEVFLDCGCGTGRLLNEFEDRCITIGIDVSNRYCHIARKRAANSLIIQGDVEYLPLKDESVDICVMVYTFVYIPNKLKALKEIRRVLRRGGVLVIFDPNSLSLRNFLRNLQLTKRKISGKELSPSDINRLLVTSQSLSIFEFKKMASKVGLSVIHGVVILIQFPSPCLKKDSSVKWQYLCSGYGRN